MKKRTFINTQPSTRPTIHLHRAQAKECAARGAEVEVILPFYECIPPEAVEGLTLEFEFECPSGAPGRDGAGFEPRSVRTQAWSGRVDGVRVLLLRPDWAAPGGGGGLFRGARVYGGSYPEGQAYLYFCRAALEALARSGRRPDVVHAHEWQCAAVPMLFWELGMGAAGGPLAGARPALTIHNVANAGECRQDEFAASGAPGSLFASVEKALDERTVGHNPERLCLLKGGVVYASAVTTVSPTYARECREGGAAGWLGATLARPDVAAKFSVSGFTSGSCLFFISLHHGCVLNPKP